jgi:hypothetical protein
VVDRDEQFATDGHVDGERGGVGLDPNDHRLAEKLEPRILLERTGQEARLAQHLEPVADADHRAAVARKGVDRLHDRREPGDGTGPQIVAVGEPARQHHGVDAAERRVAVPQQRGLAPEGAHCLDHVELAVRTREDHDADA